MIILNIFRILMVFPFILYGICRLNGMVKKKARLFMGPIYMLSSYFVFTFVFETIFLIIIYFILITLVVTMSIVQIMKRYHHIIMSVFVRLTFRNFAKVYPLFYGVAITYGLITYMVG